MWTPKQQKANRKKWVKALRSGAYQQCTDELFNGAGGYCCLGVLARVAGQSDRSIRLEGELSSFPEVMEFVGLKQAEGEFEGGSLAKLNDGGKSFAEIADIIESEPPGLFEESA